MPRKEKKGSKSKDEGTWRGRSRRFGGTRCIKRGAGETVGKADNLSITLVLNAEEFGFCSLS